MSRRYFAEKSGRDLDADEMVRGYEVDQGKYVVITDEELDRLAPEKTRDIDLKLFVKAETIPPVHFERGYFLTPAANSEKAYKLLARAMEEEGNAGIASFVMRGKEHLVGIFSDNGILRAETMRFADELRSPADVGLPKKKKIPAATLRKFETLIKKKTKRTFAPAEDEETRSLLKLVKKKQAKRGNVVVSKTEEPEKSNVIDLMAVLKKSLAGRSK